MKAMIFAAGLGSRLLPLTTDRPKALVEIRGKPLLQILLEKFIQAGVSEVIVNVHHFADQVKKFLLSNNNFGIKIEISDETDLLLDTGGGIKKTSWFFEDGEPFLVHNVDVLTNLDLEKMLEYHKTKGGLATLAVRNRDTSRYLLFDDKQRLCGWENISSGEKILVNPEENLIRFAFSGVHIIDPALFKLITETGKFSIINTYLRLAKSNLISAYPHDFSTWKDVGKPQDLKDADNTYDLLI